MFLAGTADAHVGAVGNLAPPVAGVQLPLIHRPGRDSGMQGTEYRALPHPDQIVLSINCDSWVLLTAPIWVASTLPFLKIIRVGIPRTL